MAKTAVKKGKPKITERAIRFLKGSWSELKKVHWPTRKEMLIYVSVVLVAVLIIAVLLWGIDTLFSNILSLVI